MYTVWMYAIYMYIYMCVCIYIYESCRCDRLSDNMEDGLQIRYIHVYSVHVYNIYMCVCVKHVVLNHHRRDLVFCCFV
jgi:hypothetical protein